MYLNIPQLEIQVLWHFVLCQIKIRKFCVHYPKLNSEKNKPWTFTATQISIRTSIQLSPGCTAIYKSSLLLTGPSPVTLIFQLLSECLLHSCASFAILIISAYKNNSYILNIFSVINSKHEVSFPSQICLLPSVLVRSIRGQSLLKP